MMPDAHPELALVARWLDGELEPAAAARVERHLADCPECQAEAARWRLVSEALAPAAHALPPGFATRACARAVSAPQVGAPLWWVALSPAGRLGLAALLLAAAAAGWNLGGTLVPAPGPAAEVMAALAAPELTAFEAASNQPGRQP
ncbi:MAG TPA: zf-HC2 domain-containing protein [Thermoanaerobaculaceae bacterium]|nr:zf-HC2 domain-containing protein [Thermoanaerobaculaceae bacterium]HRS15678.1 zf-HC2 domain-containing protein [Thermoanaerobaculaceae bacterium]